MVAVKRLFSLLEKRCRGKPSALKEDIFQIRAWLTHKRDKRPSGYMNHPRWLSAYSAFHLPLHLPELSWILEHSFKRLNMSEPKSILDLGCGPGTLSLSYLLWREMNPKIATGPAPEFYMIDLSQAALKMASELAATIDPKVVMHTRRAQLKDVRAIPRGLRADWIFLGHVLNEWGSGPRSRNAKMAFIQRIARDHLNENGVIFIIEPPLREPTTDLMWMRDRIVGLATHGEPADAVEAGSDEEDEDLEDLAEHDEESEDYDDGTDDIDDDGRGDDEDSEEEEFEEEEEDDGPVEGEYVTPEDDEDTGPVLEVVAPCPPGVRFCPMLRNHMGWCYAQPPRTWAEEKGMTPWDDNIRRAMGIRLENPGFAYMVLRAQGTGEAPKQPHAIAITDSEAPRRMICAKRGTRVVNNVPFRGAYVQKE